MPIALLLCLKFSVPTQFTKKKYETTSDGESPLRGGMPNHSHAFRSNDSFGGGHKHKRRGKVGSSNQSPAVYGQSSGTAILVLGTIQVGDWTEWSTYYDSKIRIPFDIQVGATINA